jgi:uncharacterized membrane protein
MKRFWPSLAAFGGASAVCVALAAVRAPHWGHLAFPHLLWNLFLAWIPFGFALLADSLDAAPGGRCRLAWLAGAGWLLFFPNAPYLLTDLIHLTYFRRLAPQWVWFDLLTNLLFALTGLLLGFASLALMQALVRKRAGAPAGWVFAAGALLLAGFGVYLGRFLRWNSWDVVRAPQQLVADVGERLVNPAEYRSTFGFSLLCAVVLFATYLMCCGLETLPRPADRAVDGRRPPAGD